MSICLFLVKKNVLVYIGNTWIGPADFEFQIFNNYHKDDVKCLWSTVCKGQCPWCYFSLFNPNKIFLNVLLVFQPLRTMSLIMTSLPYSKPTFPFLFAEFPVIILAWTKEIHESTTHTGISLHLCNILWIQQLHIPFRQGWHEVNYCQCP